MGELYMGYDSYLSYIDLRGLLLRSLLLFEVSLRVLSSFDNSIIFDKKKYKCVIEGELNINKKKELKMELSTGHILEGSNKTFFIITKPAAEVFDDRNKETGYEVYPWDEKKGYIPKDSEPSYFSSKKIMKHFSYIVRLRPGIPPLEK
jgi:hypothetical protein